MRIIIQLLRGSGGGTGAIRILATQRIGLRPAVLASLVRTAGSLAPESESAFSQDPQMMLINGNV